MTANRTDYKIGSTVQMFCFNRLWCNNKIVVCSFWFYNQNDWRSLIAATNECVTFITSKHFNKTNSYINAGVQWTPLRVCGIYKICFGIQFLPLPAVARLPLQVYIYFHIKQYKAKIASMPYSGIWCNSFIRVSSRIDCGGTPPTIIFYFQFSIFN